MTCTTVGRKVLFLTLSLWLVGSLQANVFGRPSRLESADDNDKAKQEVAKITHLYASRIDDKRVTVGVKPIVGERFAVTLAGELSSESERQLIETLAHLIKPAHVDLALKLTVAEGPRETRLWHLTFIPSRVRTTVDGAGAGVSAGGMPDTAGSPADNIDALVKALCKVYGSVIQRAGVGRLLLSGPPDTVYEIRRLLAETDSPWPQVQLNVWAVQVSGTPAEISKQMEKIAKEMDKAQQRIQRVQRYLVTLVRGEAQVYETHPQSAQALRKLKCIGFERRASDHLSLNEALVFLALHPNREGVVGQLQNEVL